MEPRSLLLIKMNKLEKDNWKNQTLFEAKEFTQVFRFYIPFDKTRIEDWVFVKFPEAGIWKIEIMFKLIDENLYNHPVQYIFDVENPGTDIDIVPFFDKEHQLLPTQWQGKTDLKIIPSDSLVFVHDQNIEFKVQNYDSNKDLHIEVRKKGLKTIWPESKGEVNSGEKTFTATLQDYGSYQILIWYDKQYLGAQSYEYTQFVPGESTDEEKTLMNELKTIIQKGIDYDADIPMSIRNEVEKEFGLNVSQKETSNVQPQQGNQNQKQTNAETKTNVKTEPQNNEIKTNAKTEPQNDVKKESKCCLLL